MTPIHRALHVLVAYCHLDLAGVRVLSQSEWELARDISKWYRSRLEP